MYTSNKRGICPICGNTELFYSDVEILPTDEGYSNWFCYSCYSRGEEWYKLQFTTHSFVRDENNVFIKEKE